MRLVFVNWAEPTHGSAQDLYHYALTARQLGHEVVLYGPLCGGLPIERSLDVKTSDVLVFVFEFTTYLERLDYARLLSRVPRERRIVIDCDGKYNDAIKVNGDRNHADAEDAARWVEACDSLSDIICQPTLHPLRPNVRPFLFHGYAREWERRLEFGSKPLAIGYVGNNWYRWKPLARFFRALEPVHDQIGRIGLVGNGWDPPVRPDPREPDEAYESDSALLRRFEIDVSPSVHFRQVITQMSRAVVNPVLYRPLFDRLDLVTCRTFESPAASTIPLFAQPTEHVVGILGESARDLVLPAEQPAEKVLDVLTRPDDYVGAVCEVRGHLRRSHSYEQRLQDLVDLVPQ